MGAQFCNGAVDDSRVLVLCRLQGLQDERSQLSLCITRELNCGVRTHTRALVCNPAAILFYLITLTLGAMQLCVAVSAVFCLLYFA